MAKIQMSAGLKGLDFYAASAEPWHRSQTSGAELPNRLSHADAHSQLPGSTKNRRTAAASDAGPSEFAALGSIGSRPALLCRL